jgi:hypothetical protein
MPGALVQLQSGANNTGADAYLTGSPEVTLWRSQHKRISPFAKEYLELVLNGTANFGGKCGAVVNRMGDLLGDLTLVLTFPDLSEYRSPSNPGTYVGWSDAVALQCIESVSLEIGGTIVDRVIPQQILALQLLNLTADKRAAADAMIGRFGADYNPSQSNIKGGTYFVKLPFFNRLAGQSIPLAALSYSDVRVNIEFKKYQSCIRSDEQVFGLENVNDSLPPSLEVKLLAEFVVLGPEERLKITKTPLEYLYAQNIQTLSFSTTSAERQRKVSLQGFQHPVSSLIFVYIEAMREDTDAVNGNDSLNFKLLADSEADAVEDVLFQINGVDLGVRQPGLFHRLLHTHEHFTSVPWKDMIYTMSFALHPSEDLSPTGSINFSKLDNSQLSFTISEKASQRGRVLVMARNWQLLRVSDGIAGLAFAI